MRSRAHRLVHPLAMPAIVLLALSACGGGERSQPPPSTSPPQEAAKESGEARIFFASPADGAEVTSPVKLDFGAENVSVDPIEDPLVAREGSIHFHVGFEADCLPPGEVIPTADPWVHFGDGSSVFETQLEPGVHRLTLQAGDGEHRTLEGDGYCTSISITVVEGGGSGLSDEASAEGDPS